jgi:hypothetical protein
VKEGERVVEVEMTYLPKRPHSLFSSLFFQFPHLLSG